MRRVILILMLAFALPMAAQNVDYETFRQQQREKFKQFQNEQQDKYDAFRREVNAKYVSFMRAAWAEFPVSEADVPEEEQRIAPVEYDSVSSKGSKVQRFKGSKGSKVQGERVNGEEVGQDTLPEHATNWSFSFRFGKDGEDEKSDKSGDSSNSDKSDSPSGKPIAADTTSVVVVPPPSPAPAPIAPVAAGSATAKQQPIAYYGSLITVSFPAADMLRIGELTEDHLADAWQQLASKKYDITVKTALDARKNGQLCDWAYMDVLRIATEQQYGATNEAILMQAFLMTQSGYRIRLAKAGDKLFMLVASKYQIYNMRYLSIEGTKYYVTGDYQGERLQMCPSRFDKEQSLSLQLATLPKLGNSPTPKRKLTSRKGVTTSVSVNKNLIAFFHEYPQANIDGDFTTRWAAYANTPLDKSVREELYPPLKQTIASMSERDAVGILLNWVQTAFQYGYDDEIWGGDRAFFAQETLYYPKCDCEDRAILFSRLVRDLVGLDVALVYYPGHLAAAVAFSRDEEGDWFTYGGRRYVVCDPTYINAPVGMTMPGMDNQTAKIIVLK